MVISVFLKTVLNNSFQKQEPNVLLIFFFFGNGGSGDLEEQENGDCDPPLQPPLSYCFKILDKSRAFHPWKCLLMHESVSTQFLSHILYSAYQLQQLIFNSCLPLF